MARVLPATLPALQAVRAVLLDMDGTLVDSDAVVERAWRSWAGEQGIEAASVLAVAHGRPPAATVGQVAPWLSPAQARRATARHAQLEEGDATLTPALPGAHRLLEELRRLGLPWAVVTGAGTRLARGRLRAAGIDPPLLVPLDDVPAGKPAPDGFLLAAARLGADPRHCLVVEDSVPGIEAGHRAGALVAVLRGLPADLGVADLGELAELLRLARSGAAR